MKVAAAGFKRFSCRGQANGSLEIELVPAMGELVIWDGAHVNGDEARTRVCLEIGARSALDAFGKDGQYSVRVISIEDHDGRSPPFTFQECMRLAIGKALGESNESIP
ncbi:hypothetical protein [Hydrogenophaga sp. 5NK40-0174]|uniref:hypothetical protein n=1 Tax=Hydrogenophaga sp. 5NK40-0174 TaxID=3127649 RepID=UPI003342A684